VRADRTGEVLAVLPKTGVQILPLWPRPGEPAKRVIIQAQKSSGAAAKMLPGLVLHRDAGGGYTPEADAILRGEATLARHFRGL
jgi:tRNA1(Val) A37 N6-methylase TrmN6